jgi:hypothetical protein
MYLKCDGGGSENGRLNNTKLICTHVQVVITMRHI